MKTEKFQSTEILTRILITLVKDRLGHNQRYAIDPTKITNALGWYPETKFEVGIVKTIEWYLNNQPWVEEVTSGLILWAIFNLLIVINFNSFPGL
ncbi:GDP-mannose 4,6-dehydratase [Bacteroides caccae]|nr:GDP-mannose 4,6-dehydratase [Bacteroides caccae]